MIAKKGIKTRFKNSKTKHCLNIVVTTTQQNKTKVAIIQTNAGAKQSPPIYTRFSHVAALIRLQEAEADHARMHACVNVDL